jgi:general secretion pathway protein A
VSLATLQAAWTGSFSTWWRPPGPPPHNDWARARLLALQGPDSAGAPRTAPDEALRRRVFAFQVSQGLALDGLIGPLTLMQLNRASGVDEPRLRKEP